MKLLDKPCIQLPKFGMDAPCIELCNLLNRLPGLETSESCCGHCKEPYMVFFRCDNLDTLTRLGRSIDRRYSDGKWKIELDSGDSNPKNRFCLMSVEPFKNGDEMLNSVEELMENILYWFNDKYDEYFDSDGHISDCTEQERSLSWTSPRESQRLLSCGLSPETSDATYAFSTVGKPHWNFVPTVTEPDKEYDNPNTLPCWTLGNLMRMLSHDFFGWRFDIDGKDVIMSHGTSRYFSLKNELIENVVDALCFMLKEHQQKKTILVLDNGHGK